MIKNWYRRYILPASILTGTVIGAGIFSLPYAVAEAGWVLSALYGTILVAFVAAIHLMFLEIIEKTKEEYRFVGYVRKYLGSVGFGVSLLIAIPGLLLTLNIYLALAARFLGVLFPGGYPFLNMLGFWAIAAVWILADANLLAVSEYVLSLGIYLVIGFVFVLGVRNWDGINMATMVDTRHYLVPLGVFFFALMGRSAIPSVVRYYKESKIPMRFANPAVLIGTLVPALCYAFFAIGVIQLSGEVSRDSITGLFGGPYFVVKAVGALGLLALMGTYIVLGIDAIEDMRLDLRVPKWIGTLAVLVGPLVLYAAGLRNFYELIGIVGGVFLSFEAVMIALMWRKVTDRRLSKGLALTAVAFFVIGVLCEIIKAKTF